MKHTLTSATNRRWRAPLFAAAMVALVLGPAVALGGRASAAACQAPGTDYGAVTTSATIPAAATYQVWTRVSVPDATNNTYLLEIDGNKCYTVGGGSIQANSWVWVAHQGGNTNSKIDVALTQGSHSLKLIGNKPNVKIDRVVFSSDLNCTPTGNGDNCNVPSDTSAPVVRITAPAANASVSGAVAITATATDNTNVTKVEMYINSSLLGTDTSSPYSFQWDTTKIPNGEQLLTAKAYDATGNVGTDSFKVTAQNGDRQAPSVPSGVTAKATAYNSITVSWKASTDDTAVKGYSILRDGVPIADVGNVTSFVNAGLSANTTYSYKVLAFDLAGNKSAASSAVSAKTPTVADSQDPTKPTGLTAMASSTTQINLAWTPSTDNIGVTGYDVYRSSGDADPEKIATTVTPAFGDTNLTPNTTYAYYVVANDASGNASDPSNSVMAKTQVVTKKHYSIRGTITDQKMHKAIRYAGVTATIDGHRHIYQANRSGVYAIQNLENGRYNLIYRATNYYSKTAAVKLADKNAVKDITLQKR